MYVMQLCLLFSELQQIKLLVRIIIAIKSILVLIYVAREYLDQMSSC